RRFESLWKTPSRRMAAVLHAKNRRRRSPRVADVLSHSEISVVIPVPVCGIGRRRQRKCGKMKSHPAAAVVHVLLECGPFSRVFGSRIQKHHHLISGKKIRSHVVPV